MVRSSKKSTLCEKAKQEIRRRALRAQDGADGADGAAVLPSERGLADELAVSRLTVRNAYQALVNEGLLVPSPQGYRVRRVSQEGVLTVDGFTKGIGTSETTRTEIVEISRIPPERVHMLALQCGLHETILRITRLRVIGRQPCQLERCHVVEGRFPGLAEHDLSSLYKLFEGTYGIRVVRAEQLLEVTAPPEDVRSRLRLAKSARILFLTRTSFDERNRPVEYVHLYLNPAGRQFFMDLKR
jgi:GntR family transcriptional regulator